MKSSLCKWIISSFIIILSFSFVIGLFQFFVTGSRYKEELLLSRRELLNQLDHTINHYFRQETDSMTFPYRIVNSLDGLKNFNNIKSPITEGIGLIGIETVNMLESIVKYYSYIDSIQVYFPQSELILSDKGIKYLSAKIYSDSYKKKWLPVDQFDASVSKKWLYNNRNHINADNNTEVLTLLCTLPLIANSQDVTGYIMINFNTETLFSIFLDSTKDNDDCLQIYNNNTELIFEYYNNRTTKDLDVNNLKSNILYALNAEESNNLQTIVIDGEKLFYINFTSPFNQWRYVVIKSYSSYYESIKKYILKTTMITLSALIFAAFFITLISKKLYKPIRSLTETSLQYLEASNNCKQKSDEYTVINECIRTLNARYSKAYNYIHENSYLIKRGLFFSIVNNTENLNNISQILADLNIHFETEIFTLIRVNLSTTPDLNGMAAIEKIVSYYAPSLCITQHNEYLVFLLNLSTIDDYLNEYIKKIKTDIQYLMHYDISCMVVYPYNNISDTYSNLQLLNELAKYSYIFDKNTIITPSLVNTNLSSHKQMLDIYSMIDRLMELVRTGSYKEVNNQIDNLIDNIKSDFIDINMIEMLTSYIIILINRLSEHFSLKLDRTIFEKYYKVKSLEDYREILRQNCFDIMVILEKKKDENRAHLIENILAYMKQNIDIITLQLLSDHFSINKTYLSELFIKELGVNYNDVLKNLKIERAKYLLNTKQASSKNVAEKVGYSNPKYFAKLFKSNTGYTPKEFIYSVNVKY